MLDNSCFPFLENQYIDYNIYVQLHMFKAYV